MKKIISYMLSVCLIVGTFPAMAHIKVDAEIVLSDPVVGEEGIATWDCVYFGEYPQSDATGEISEPIKWRVLSVSEEEALLMADSNLDVQRYNDSFGDVTWENSTLRGWLNDYFLNKAFSEEEQQYILDTTVENSRDNEYGISCGNDTVDKVFVLSAAEAMNDDYGFVSGVSEDSGRIRRNTAYVAAGGYLVDEGSNAYVAGSPDAWWLRTPGAALYKAATAMYKGDISTEGDIVSFRNCVVCPVIKIDISSDLWNYAGTVNSKEETDDGVEETTMEETSTDEVTTEEITTEEPTTERASDKEVSSEHISQEYTASEETTKQQISSQEKITEKKIKVAKSKIKKATKKIKSKSIKVSFKKIENANKYQVAFSTTKKFKKTLVKKTVKKTSTTIKNKKLKNKKKLYVRVRAIAIKSGVKYHGKWSKVKKVKIK